MKPVQVAQVVCPDVLRHDWHRPDPVNSPPPEVQSGDQVRSWLVVGAEGWVYPYAIYRDEDDRLWCQGGAGVDPFPGGYNDHRTVHVLRTEHGVRVLEWPTESTWGNSRPRIHKGTVFSGDCWVVEFPRVTG